MTAQLPAVLALVGSVLLALALFAPARATPAGTPTAVRPAPPAAAIRPAAVAEPAWPALVDPAASGCDAAIRTRLVAALAATGGSWATGVLQAAALEERDAAVRAALAAAGADGQPAYGAGSRGGARIEP